MPRRKKRNWTRWDAWIAKQETKKPADEQKLEVTGQEPADDLEVQVRGQEQADDLEVQVRGQEPADDLEVQVRGQADDLEVQVRGQEPADDLEVQVRGQADDLEVQVRGQEPADDQDVEVREQEPADSPEVVETGEWKEEFMFNPFTGNDQLELADQLNLSVERYLNIQERNVPLEAPISPIRIIGDATVFNKRQTRSMSRRHREETTVTEASQVACIKRKTMLNANNDDDDRKRVRRDRERKRYQEDPEYAKAQRDGKKTRYSTDKQHAQEKRERERERALERYHTDDNHAQQNGTSIDADWATSWNEEGGLVEPSDAEQGGNGALEVHTAPEHRESVTEEGDHMEGPTTLFDR
ncbi:uncharacterized protein DDB_G0283697-like [Branchiostoma floridae]|uniref:Uncharacterized protein DDB_G0283697-like n=1 Tax=Branchiostoma floridae TaxID=7739 RepID=A0A9J7MR78_BRAFL|nr:uncharacterized protein DDB_G0283697-like [Branchiostoma floridae]